METRKSRKPQFSSNAVNPMILQKCRVFAKMPQFYVFTRIFCF